MAFNGKDLIIINGLGMLLKMFIDVEWTIGLLNTLNEICWF